MQLNTGLLSFFHNYDFKLVEFLIKEISPKKENNCREQITWKLHIDSLKANRKAVRKRRNFDGKSSFTFRLGCASLLPTAVLHTSFTSLIICRGHWTRQPASHLALKDKKAFNWWRTRDMCLVTHKRDIQEEGEQPSKNMNGSTETIVYTGSILASLIPLSSSILFPFIEYIQT